jgi:hypothetical protein
MAGEPRAPGWYPDHNDPAFNRYWNGRAWTARRHPVNATTPPRPVTQPTVVASRPPAVSHPALAPAPAKKRLPVWVWVVGSLMVARSVLGVVAAFDNPDPGSTSTVTPHPTAVSSPAAAH